MIYTLSDKIVLYLEMNNKLKDDREIYLYGAKLVVSSMIGTVLLLVFGLLMDCFIEAVMYELIMSSSRSILGGYHCKSYTKCIFMYVGLFVINIMMIEAHSFNIVEVLIISILTLLITSIMCPIQNINKLISSKKKKVFKIYTLIYIYIYLFVVVYLFSIGSSYLDVLISMLVIINILTIGGKIDYEKNKK